MKRLLLIAIGLLHAFCHGAGMQLQFLNKLDVPILFSAGTQAAPPKIQAAMQDIAPGKESKLSVQDNPWILFYEKGKPENAFIYQFNTGGKSKLAIRIVASGNGSKIEPQTTLGMKIGGNVMPNDIIPVGAGSTIGAAPKPAAPIAPTAPKPVAPASVAPVISMPAAPGGPVVQQPQPVKQLEAAAPVVPQAPPMTQPKVEVPAAPPLVRPASIPQAPPMTVVVPQAPPMTAAIPQAPPMGPVVPQAPPMGQPKVEVPAAPPMEPTHEVKKVSGPAMSSDLQEQIKAGMKLKPAGETTHQQKPKTAAEEAAEEAKKAILKRGAVVAAEEEEEHESEAAEIDPVKIKQLAADIKKEFAAQYKDRLTDKVADDIARELLKSGGTTNLKSPQIQRQIPGLLAKFNPLQQAGPGNIGLPFGAYKGPMAPQAPSHATEEEWGT